jgi:enoyl-[acyl-carrier protein] reductase III
MNHSWRGKKAFITGSSRGIGRAIAIALAAQGCEILLHYRKDRTAADETLKAVKNLGVEVSLYQADLCDAAANQEMLDRLVAEHKTLDIYVANAASTAFKPLLDLTPAHFDKTFQLVVKSFVTSVQRLRPLMSGRGARILTISGIDTVKFCPGHGLLAAAKAALETLTHYFAVELAGDGIRAKCLNPGLVASDSTRFYMGEAFDEVCRGANAVAPQGGFAEPEKVAKIVLALLAPETDWMCGQTVYADGGLSFMLPGMGTIGKSE